MSSARAALATVPTYWEGDVLASMGPATWDTTKHQLVITGASTYKFSAATP